MFDDYFDMMKRGQQKCYDMRDNLPYCTKKIRIKCKSAKEK